MSPKKRAEVYEAATHHQRAVWREEAARLTTAPRKPPPSHPGAILKEIVLPALKEQGLGKVDFAARLNIGRRTLYDLLDEKTAVTPAMALRLSALLGNSPEHWMNLQAAYDLARAREALGDELSAIQPVKAA
jgi:addiction module HigA family antidote